jgi:hypothetical protein
VLSFRLILEGWLLALALFILTPISAIVTFLRVRPMDLYRAMGLSDEELAMVQRMNYTNRGSMMVWAIAGAAIGISFALAARRAFFFRPEPARGFSVTPPPVQNASSSSPPAPPSENAGSAPGSAG